ncbi:hypothetical protein SRABI70_00722 [Pseudomonas sp. Bi70]|nr:hypothetical protein SRABI70_00722 [Pseudomonas sp. Bi70]
MKNLVYSLLLITSLASAHELPASILEQIPEGYSVLRHASGELNDDALADYLVVVHKSQEATLSSEQPAPARPLLLFTQRTDGSYALSKRNDQVVFRVDEGGQCDPFGDDGRGLVINKRYFTIENGVACGQHWTDYITFRYDTKLKDWVFHKRIFENWVPNDSEDPDAEALVMDAHKVTTATRNAPIRFADYSPPDR